MTMTEDTESVDSSTTDSIGTRLTRRLSLPATVRVVEVCCAVGAVVIVTPLYGGCFATQSYLLPIGLAAPIGALTMVAPAVRRWARPWVSAVPLVICLVYLGIAVLRPTFVGGLPTGLTATTLRDGVFGGWLRLLTSGVPMDVTPVLLTTPVLIAYWCGWLAARQCLRSTRSALPAVPGAVALVAALVFGAPLLRPAWALTTGWLLLVVSVVLLRSNRLADRGLTISSEAARAIGLDLAAQQRRSMFTRLAFGLPVLLLVVTFGVAGAVLLPIARGDDRFDVRSVVQQPFDVDESLNPLATIQNQLSRDQPQTLFTVGGLPAGVDRVRTAVLSAFDGAVWTVADDFVVAGRTLPTDPLTPSGESVTMTVTVDSLQGPFLPVVGAPITLDGVGLGFGAASSTLVAGLSTPRPVSYSVTGVVVPAPESATIAENADTAGYLTLPTPPGVLLDIAREITAEGTTPFAKARLLADYLRAQPYDVAARPGQSYGAITRMLAKKNPGDENGFSETHAAAFVVLARILGIPARIAVGYLIDPQATPSADGRLDVTTATAHAWAEIPVVGAGWVSFEPTDVTKLSGSLVAPPDVTVVPNTEVAGTIPVGDGAGGSADLDGDDAGIHPLVIAATVLLVIVAPGALVVAEKYRRRWQRRRKRSPSQRIMGAWREVQDRLEERGIRSPRSSTSQETAVLARSELGEPAQVAVEMAPLVSAALYAPDPPEAAVADRAWEQAHQLRHDLAAGRSWWQRGSTMIDPRPLIHFSRPTRSRRPR